MIKEGWTLIVFGYTSDEWAPKSHKLIITVCDECGEIREIKKQNYRAMCKRCACNTEEYKQKQREAKLGEKNSLFGKHLSEATKQKCRESWTEDRRKKHSDAIGGANHPLYGKNHHPASIQKMREYWTEGVRREYSESRTGKHNPMFGVTGEDAPGWKGGITPWRQTLYKSLAYKNWRASVFIRDNRACRKCKSHTRDIQAHHIIPVRDNKNTLLTFDINNGITLCKNCHEEVNGHEYDYIDMFMNIIEVGGKQ